jgi:hypothetical protein
MAFGTQKRLAALVLAATGVGVTGCPEAATRDTSRDVKIQTPAGKVEIKPNTDKDR